MHFNNPLHAANTKQPHFQKKKANSSPAESPGALWGVGSLPGRAQAPAGVATHTLCSGCRAGPYHDVVTLHLRFLAG